MNKNSFNDKSVNFLKQNNGQIDYIIDQGIKNNLNSSNKDLLIYIHIPFCTKKCNYCFLTGYIPSKTLKDIENFQDQYVDALCTQIQHIGPKLMKAGYKPKYISWGGGTPSILSIESLEKIFKVLHNSFDLSKIDEHCFEANPSSLDGEKISFLSSHGVNRMSIGVQTFNNDELKLLGCSHTAESASSTISLLRKNGINNFNIDLMFGFPEHILDNWEQTLNQTLLLDPTHISAYLYSNTPNTSFFKLIQSGKYELFTIEKMLRFHESTKNILGEKGFYENTAERFIKKSEYFHKSEYYMQAIDGEYIGFGNGANSSIMQNFLCYNDDNDSLKRYIQNPLYFDNCINYSPAIFDNNKENAYIRLTNALFTSKGINFKDFYTHYGFNFSESKINAELLDIAQNIDLIDVSDESISIPNKNRNIIYIKSILQALRKRIMSKQYSSKISNK